MEDAAKVLLSGEYSRRRAHLSGIITRWDQLALTGTLAIWALLLPWNAIFGENADPELFSTLVAFSGALSSLLIGFWRFRVRNTDDAIVALYPAMYLAERTLGIPSEVCTIKPPLKLAPLTKADIVAGVAYVTICNRQMGGRGHSVGDWIAVGFIVASGIVGVAVGRRLGVITLWGNTPHAIGFLLIFNIIGLLLVLAGYVWWRQRQLLWPVPNSKPDAA